MKCRYLTNYKAEGSDCCHPDCLHLDDSVKVRSLTPGSAAGLALMPPCPQSAACAPLLRPDCLPHHQLDRDAGVDGDGHDQREKNENCCNDYLG